MVGFCYSRSRCFNDNIAHGKLSCNKSGKCKPLPNIKRLEETKLLLMRFDTLIDSVEIELNDRLLIKKFIDTPVRDYAHAQS